MPIIVRGSNRRFANNLRKHLVKTGKSWGIRQLHHLPRRVSWLKDLLLALPEPALVVDQPPNYSEMRRLFAAHKRGQWHILREFFKTPEIENPPYVIRPLRHSGGEGFEVSDTLPDESKAATHYWRSLWKRNSEYRVIYVDGEKICTLLKRVPEGTKQDIPWSAGVSSFVTVRNDDNDRLRYTEFYQSAENFLKRYPYRAIAFDLLYRKREYRLVEINFNPCITIDDNFKLVVKKIGERLC